MARAISSTLLLFALFYSSSIFSQEHYYEGTWIKLNTTYLFDFELTINHLDNNEVEGYFIWEVIQYDEGSTMSKNHYENRLGTIGKEFVRGTYDATTKNYILKGFKKEDPNQIIGLDTYHIKVDESDNIGGDTKANGSWKGRINGKKVKKEIS